MVGVVVDDDRRAAEHDRQARAAPAASSRRLPSRNAAAIPATKALAVNTTSRPSTNESAAASSQTAAGAANGKRRRASSGSTTSATAGTANQRVVRRRLRARRAGRDLEGALERRDHDQHVEAVPPREAPEPGHAVNVLHVRPAPPPTRGRRRDRRPVRAPNAAFRRRPLAAAVLSVVASNATAKGRIMKATTPRLFGPARIVALALIALAAAALAYLRFAPDAAPVSVPAGAHAGELTLKPCTYATEHGSYAPTAARCRAREPGTTPRSRLIALPVTRIRARSAHPGDADLPARGRARPHQHGASRTRAASPTTTTSSSSATAASTARRGSTAPRSSRRSKHSADFLGAGVVRRVRATRSDPAQGGCRPTASTSPATRCRSASTISRPPGARSAIAGSTCSARAPARARR